MPGCVTCELGLDHCHALLVEHDDGAAECLDGCGGPRAVHDDVVAGAEIGCTCCTRAPVAGSAGGAEPARAAA